MQGPAASRSVRLRSREGALCCLLLVAVVWFGSFFEFERFSLYVDDLSFLGRVFQTPNLFLNYLINVGPYSDGRPIQFGLIDLTGAIMTAAGSLGPAYIFLFALTAASIVATWWALTYRFSNAVALLAATILALSPLVSVRPFLNGIASPVALIFLMLATVLYVKGRPVLAYLVSTLILLSYELTFPVFALLPALLMPARTRRDAWRLAGHVAICVGLLSAYAVFKGVYGGARLGGAMAGHGAIELVAGIVRASFRSLGYGVLRGVDVPLWLERITPSSDMICWAVLAFAGFAALLRHLAPSRTLLQRDRNLAVQTVALLLLMALAGYSLVYFGYPDGARNVFGRDSRFHSVANLPLSILTALVLVELLALARRVWLRATVIGLAAGYLALIFAFSVSHQEEFARETDRQRRIVTQLILDHPVMDRQATFLIEVPAVDERHRPSIEYEDGHSFYYLLADFFDFSKGTGERVGPAIRMMQGDGWRDELTLGPDGAVVWPSWSWPPTPEHAGHIWLYRSTADGALTPVPGPLLVGGRDVLHEGPDVPDDALDLSRATKLPLFGYMMGSYAPIVDAILQHRTPLQQDQRAAASPSAASVP